MLSPDPAGQDGGRHHGGFPPEGTTPPGGRTAPSPLRRRTGRAPSSLQQVLAATRMDRGRGAGARGEDGEGRNGVGQEVQMFGRGANRGRGEFQNAPRAVRPPRRGE